MAKTPARIKNQNPKIMLLAQKASGGKVSALDLAKETANLVVDIAVIVEEMRIAIKGYNGDPGLVGRMSNIEKALKIYVADVKEEEKEDRDSFNLFWIWIRDKALPPVVTAIIVSVLVNSF